MPVVVTDQHGHHVADLKASDFEVFEDGKPEQIVALSTVADRAPSQANGNPSGQTPVSGRVRAAASSAAGSPRRTYLVVVDTLHSSFGNFARVRDALGKFFEHEQEADAQYAVMALGREVKVIQDSTRDPANVLAAVRARRFANVIADSESANIASSADEFTVLMRQYCSACACIGAGPAGDGPGCAGVRGRVQAFLESFAARTFLLNSNFLSQLAEIVRALSTMPTSRTVIFVSDGFNRFPGRELYGILQGYGPRDRTFEFNPRDTQPQLDAILKLATRYDIKFYTLDSRGLYTQGSLAGSGFSASSSSATAAQMDSRESPNLAAGAPESVELEARSVARENTDALAELAHQTGGIFYENSNDLLKGLRQAVADGREYYVLAYVPDNKAADGSWRRIAVTVRDRKWRVNAKAGYWASGH